MRVRAPSSLPHWLLLALVAAMLVFATHDGAAGPGPIYPTLLNPTTGSAFPQISRTNNQVCPASQQCNAVGTSTAPVTIKLPTTPPNGAILAIIDADRFAQLNTLTVSGNGKLIDGSSSVTITQAGGGLVAQYTSSAGEWVTVAFLRKVTATDPGTSFNLDERPPSSSFPPVTLAGDAVGPAGANTVVKVNGQTFPAAGTAGNLLTSNGTAWTSAPPPATPLTWMWSPAWIGSQLNAANGALWSLGDYSAGSRFTVLNADMVISAVRFYAAFTGGGSRTIEVRLCSCTSSGCTSLDTASALITSGTIATIPLTTPTTLQASTETNYEVSAHDGLGVGTYYPYLPIDVPANRWGIGSGTSSNGLTNNGGRVIPWVFDATRTVLFDGSYYAAGRACPTAGAYLALVNEFYAVEPVLQ